ncbi:hypothetical protein [Nostocoides jenkinsii]|uniref:Uncharacterized protein n=1 Tax=Nostocoides jenkinsii Ben 74 TaxID=1193518 RepID=A0A077MF33_9MICO|nr:hypothetical protein [Tetrasphaera jenkinsii]CCI54625.1 hypothetical protein BN13_790004 [Tetrasphaera jenkinsii Ben 74]
MTDLPELLALAARAETDSTNTIADAERWHEEVGGTAYVLDDESAIVVTDGGVEVVSEGRWRRFS